MTSNANSSRYEASSVPCRSAIQVLQALNQASKLRTVSANACNAQSSRSHLILQIYSAESQSCLSLVDLAGSERLANTKVEGDRLKETQAINKSLSALADVISALKEKSGHVPYRNSKLTYLLQQ